MKKQSLSKEIEDIKKNQILLLELKTKITEWEQERISELENRMGITQSEQQRENGLQKQNEQSFNNLCEYNKKLTSVSSESQKGR